MSSSNLSSFYILFTKPKSTDSCIIQIVPATADTYSVKCITEETDNTASNTTTSTEAWICPKAIIRQYIRNCVTFVLNDMSGQRYTNMEIQIPVFPTCLVNINNSDAVDRLLNIAFEHLDVISADDAKNWPTKDWPTKPTEESTTAETSNN